MQHRDRRRYEMLTRVRAFGEANRQLFPAESEVHDAFATVGTTIGELNELGVSALVAARAAGVEAKGVARRALLDTLTRVMQTADVMQEDAWERSWKTALPARADDVQLLTTARFTRQRATPSAARFAAHGIPLEELDARIADFEQAKREHNSGRTGSGMARARIDSAFQRAMRAVGVIEVSVTNYFAADPSVQAAWQHARKLGFKHRPPRRAPKTTAIATRQVGVGQAESSRVSALFQFFLSKLRGKRRLPPPSVEVDVIEPLARKPPRLLGP